jgi:dihydroflavonol-4-reductase
MTTVLLTGATGFIGGHVAWALITRGYEVRALVRPGRELPWRHDSLSTAVGDVRDRNSVARAMVGCDAVVHCAALYALWTPKPQELYDVNVEGTRNVLEAAVAARVARIVHTSTVGTVAFRRRGLANEADVAQPAAMSGHYKRSKFEAERIARRMADAGQPIVIVNPTTPVGPGDAGPTPTGRIISDFLRGALPAFVDTGLNFVDVTDVADGHVLALERGTPGARYILGNVDGNLTLARLLEQLASLTGLRAPRVKLPHAIVHAAAWADHALEGVLAKREPRIPLEGVRMSRQRMWVDPSKAVRELGVPQRPIEGALAQAIEWYVHHGYAPAPPRQPTPAGGSPTGSETQSSPRPGEEQVR